MARIGVVGLGRMGANIARRIHELATAHSVTVVYDRDAAATKELAAELQAKAAQKPADVGALADLIFTVVSDDAAMQEIFANDASSLLAQAQGRIFVNCATVTPNVQREISHRAQAAGAKAIEACMAGSITQARGGTLVLLCGGERATVDELRPVLDLMGTVHYIGESGRAAEVKALVNMLMNINTAALAEALGLGAALGLDLDMLQRIFAQTGANSRVLETDGADMVARDHEVYFSAAHAAKDSGIALQLAQEQHLETPLAALTKTRYDQLVRAGFGDSDKSAIAELSFPGRTAVVTH